MFNSVSPQHQMDMVQQWMHQLGVHFSNVSAMAVAAGSFFKSNEALMQAYGGVKHFEARYPLLKDLQSLKEKKEGELVRAHNYFKDTN